MRWLVVLALAACGAAHGDPDRTADFMTLYKVLENPRCMNCHPSGDAPLQYDDSRPHGMDISRRSEKNGVACATCHREHNGARPGQPPGAPNWHLPPPETPMVFQGRTPHQLCEQLKDPKQTGGRDLAHLIEHVGHDPLVSWGWDPGPGRIPVAIPRAEVVAAMQRWADAGAPCPE